MNMENRKAELQIFLGLVLLHLIGKLREYKGKTGIEN
jgi:hypothetical protein